MAKEISSFDQTGMDIQLWNSSRSNGILTALQSLEKIGKSVCPLFY